MAKIWRERLDPERHRDYMTGSQDAGGFPVEPSRDDGWVYCVRECAFTFQFVNLDQVRQCLAYFSQKVHPARRVPGVSIEHYWQRWFERLPPGLNGGEKRTRVARALERALREFDAKRAG